MLVLTSAWRRSLIVEDLSAQPDASVPQASGDWATTKATYRFWDNPRVQPEDIIGAHQQSTRARLEQHEVILAIQDTTGLSFNHHPSKTVEQGFGPISSYKYSMGLKVHSILAASSEGVPLGILDQQTWAREPKKKKKCKAKRNSNRPLAQKETRRWLTGLVNTELSVPDETTVVSVADREADIYELFALKRAENSELLIRAAQNRRVDHPSHYLQEAIAKCEPAGSMSVEVHAKDGQVERTAELSIRFGQFKLLPPSNRPKSAQLPPVQITVIWAHEENPPEGCKPISWLLLTTLSVTTLEDALCCVRWYSYRWLIERFHFALKSGCNIEQLQLESANRIMRALATYSIVAWRLLWLTYEARVNPNQSCEIALEGYEWKALFCHTHQCTQTPSQPPSLHQAIRWIAQLGGFLGRKGDGEPGVKTIWRGLRRLHDIASTWKLLCSQPHGGAAPATCG